MKTFSVIGTGNMAWFLAGSLVKAGWKCLGVYGRNAAQVALLADSSAAKPWCSLADVPDEEGHICFLAVSDQAIGELAGQCRFRKTLLVHTAGAVALGLLGSSEHQGVLWPIYSITRNQLPTHRQIPLAWDANGDSAAALLEQAASDLSDLVFRAGDDLRRQLHLAAVFANNFTNHLAAIVSRLCREQGISFQPLQAIWQQTMERVLQHDPVATQSGPARRGDVRTQESHIELLSTHPEWQQVYLTLSASIRRMYETE